MGVVSTVWRVCSREREERRALPRASLPALLSLRLICQVGVLTVLPGRRGRTMNEEPYVEASQLFTALGGLKLPKGRGDT